MLDEAFNTETLHSIGIQLPYQAGAALLNELFDIFQVRLLQAIS
jgi:hypothetical protein